MARARRQRTSISFAALGAHDSESIPRAPGIVLALAVHQHCDTHETRYYLQESDGDVEH